jgi:hypothetical protein
VTDFEQLLTGLPKHQVAFIVIGGAAAIAHGSARHTEDLDIVYQRSPVNLDRLVEALSPLKPYLRGAAPGLPFVWDTATLKRGLNFTLVTTVGNIDALGEIVGGGTYEDLLPGAVELELFGTRCYCLSLRQLIRAKRAAGQPRDFDAIAELEAIEEEPRLTTRGSMYRCGFLPLGKSYLHHTGRSLRRRQTVKLTAADGRSQPGILYMAYCWCGLGSRVHR